MPREATITYEQVAAIADAIKAEGGRAQWRTVRERLGTGSSGTIHRMLQQWKAGQERQIVGALALPPTLQRSILDFLGQELAGAKAALETELAESQQAAGDLAVENERQVNQIEMLQTVVDELHGDKATLEGRLAQMGAELTAARDEALRERQAAEAARTESAKALLRLEAMPRLEKDLLEVRSAYQQTDLRRQEAERGLAVGESERKAAEARVLDLAAKFEEARAKLAQWEGDAKAAGAKAEAFEAQWREQKQRSLEVIGRLEADKQRMESELSEARKEGKQTATYVGKLEGIVEALGGKPALKK